jgi:hypothetical protein
VVDQCFELTDEISVICPTSVGQEHRRKCYYSRLISSGLRIEANMNAEKSEPPVMLKSDSVGSGR